MPTFALFYKQIPLLNLGNLDISVHLTTKLFSDLCKKVAQAMTQDGGPLSNPPLLPPKPPRPPPRLPPLLPPRPPKDPLPPDPPLGVQLNSLPIKQQKYNSTLQKIMISFIIIFKMKQFIYWDSLVSFIQNLIFSFIFIIQLICDTMEKEVEEKLEKTQEKTETQTEEKEEKNDAEQNIQGKKDPETLSEAQRLGWSKQQLRKLQKRLNAKKKKEDKEIQAAKIAKKKQEIKNAGNKQTQIKKPKTQLQISQQQRKQFSSQKIVLDQNTLLPAQDKDNVLITSALPYVNNVPHLGNIIGCVLSADVFSRFKKLQGSNVLYICGTDQYGTATEVKAMEEKKTPQEICDHYYKIHAEVYKWFDIGFDYFGRTSTEWHSKITQEIFLNIQKEQRILKQEMTQCYCEHCDLFLADRFIVGTCPTCQFNDARGDQCDKCQKLFNNPTELQNYLCSICKKPPVVKQTIHFFIDLPQIQKQLEQWINLASKKGQWSENSITITKSWTNMGLKPKCITRDLKWGVPVPIEQFKKKVFYVWFDAPIGYISITANLLQQHYKAWWQNNKDVKLFQFMGKDNVPFHTVIFPSSLIASKQDWTLLHHISTTEYLNYESGKFSKRNGTGVFGTHVIELQKEICSQVWRYYLLVNRPEKSDSEFSWKDFIDKNNNELLANLGNLVQRVLKFIYLNYDKKIPAYDQSLQTQADIQFIIQMQSRYQKYVQLLNKVQIKEGLKFSMQVSSRGNKYLQDSKFWEKNNKQNGRTALVLNIIANFIRFQSFLIEPFMPSTSAKINFLLGLEVRTEHDAILGKIFNQEGGDFKNTFINLTAKSQSIRKPIELFNPLSEEQANTWRQRFKGIVSDA